MVAGQPVTVDWTIESRGGKTLLRVTQSNFMPGQDWEQEYFDSTNYGWGFMLLNLRHYLEHHAGKPRLVAGQNKMLISLVKRFTTSYPGATEFSLKMPPRLCVKASTTQCTPLAENCGPDARSSLFSRPAFA
jgi:hypothetical protein